MKRKETKYYSKCHQMVETIDETCPECGQGLYHIYQVTKRRKSPP